MFDNVDVRSIDQACDHAYLLIYCTVDRLQSDVNILHIRGDAKLWSLARNHLISFMTQDLFGRNLSDLWNEAS